MARDYNAWVEVHMDVRVSEIPSDGLERSFDGSKAEVRALADAAIDGELRAFSAEVTLDPPDKQGRFDAHFAIDLTFGHLCDRCSEPIEVELKEEIALRFQRAEDEVAPDPTQEEIELGEDDLDVGWYTDGTLSLADALSEAIALVMPMRSTCQDAEGCDARTAALLDASSDHAGGHPGFAALKNWT